MKTYVRFAARAYWPVLVLTLLNGLSFGGGVIGGTTLRDHVDALVIFALPAPLIYASMMLVRRSRTVQQCFFSIYPIALWFYFVLLYQGSAAFAGVSMAVVDGGSDAWVRYTHELGVAAEGFVHPLLWAVHVVIGFVCWQVATNVFQHVNTATRDLEWP